MVNAEAQTCAKDAWELLRFVLALDTNFRISTICYLYVCRSLFRSCSKLNRSIYIDSFYDAFITLIATWTFSGGTETSQVSLKIPSFVFYRLTKVLLVWKDMSVSKLQIFGWTVPFSKFIKWHFSAWRRSHWYSV